MNLKILLLELRTDLIWGRIKGDFEVSWSEMRSVVGYEIKNVRNGEYEGKLKYRTTREWGR